MSTADDQPVTAKQKGALPEWALRFMQQHSMAADAADENGADSGNSQAVPQQQQQQQEQQQQQQEQQKQQQQQPNADDRQENDQQDVIQIKRSSNEQVVDVPRKLALPGEVDVEVPCSSDITRVRIVGDDGDNVTVLHQESQL